MVKRNALGQSVVCSEKTKARGKVKSIALAVAAASAMLSSVDVVAATTLGENQTITDTTSVAIGNNVIATGADTVAVGDYTKATGDESTALGERATTFGNQATATGSYAFADGNRSTSNGHASSAMAIDTIAIGVNSGAAGGSMSKEDWDKLIVIDKEIKELDPNQFTKTVTIATDPDKTPVNEAKKVLDNALQSDMAYVAVSPSIIPAKMYVSMPELGGDDELIAEEKLRTSMNNILPTTLTGDIATAYNKLVVSDVKDQLITSETHLQKFMSLNKLVNLSMELGIINDTSIPELVLGDAYLTKTNSIGGVSPIAWDSMFNTNGATIDDINSQYASAQKALETYKKNMGKSTEQIYGEYLTSQFQQYLITLKEDVKNDAMAALNNGLSQELINKYENSEDQQAFIQAMTAGALAKSSAIMKTAQPLQDGTILLSVLDYVDILTSDFTLDSTSVIATPNVGIEYNYRGFAELNSRYPETPEGVEGYRYVIEKRYEEAKAIVQARQDAQAAYDQALAEYEAAVAAGGTTTTTTTTDLAAYEAALAEKRAELTKLANAAGFDGTFESLSDVFGSKAGRAIAIGNQAYVSGDEAVGVGYGNTVTGSRSNVIGTHNNVTKANNNVMGNDNNITVSEGNVIVGNAITFAQGVTTSDNIALGSNTVISAPVPTTSMEIQGVTHNFAGTNPTSVLSIANEGNERQIQNVAAGRVTNTSTDAINGSQLYAVVEALNAIQTINIDDISDAIGTEINVTGGDNVQVNREGNNFTISATDTNTQSSSSVVDGKGLTVTATDNANGTKNYAFEAKIGDGLVFGDNGEIKAAGTTLSQWYRQQQVITRMKMR